MRFCWKHCVIILLLVCATLCGAMAEDHAAWSAENERYVLTVDEKSGGFVLTDKENGYLWRAIPEKAEKDKGSKGLAKNKLCSTMYLTAIDRASRKPTTLVSVKAEVRLEYAEDSYTAWYDFADKGLSIPLTVTLTEDGLLIRVELADIAENGQYLVTELALLPSFFAGSPGEEGYILLPDGCGALMYFGNESWYYDYQAPVYGPNLAFNRISEAAPQMSVAMPILGIHRNNAGALGVITDGDALATVHAMPCGYESSYDTACMSFTLRNIDTQSISATVFQTVYEERLPDCAIEMRYSFFAGEYSGYDAMAAKYRRMLAEKRSSEVQAASPGIVLEAYGAVLRNGSIAGIPVDRIVPLADIGQVKAFADAIGDQVLIRYCAWSEDELKQQLPTASSVLRQIGGEAQMEALSQAYPVHLNVNPVQFSKAGLLTSDWAIKRLSQELATQYEYSRATRRAARRKGVTYMLKPEKFADTAEKISRKLPYSLCIDGAGGVCYSDFDQDGTFNRQQTLDAMQQMIQTLAGAGAMVDTGFAYALPYASCVVDAPDQSSRLKITQQTVPFYQLTLSGLVPVTGESINLTDDHQEAILKAAETGMLIKYTYLGDTYVDLTDTDLETLYAVNSDGWAEELQNAYSRLQHVYDATQDCGILRHETVAEAVVRVTWENGTVVTVNYGSDAWEDVPPCDFTVEGGNEQ